MKEKRRRKRLSGSTRLLSWVGSLNATAPANTWTLPKHRPLDISAAVKNTDDFDAGRHRPIVNDVLARRKAAQTHRKFFAGLTHQRRRCQHFCATLDLFDLTVRDRFAGVPP